jgi:purine-cytosine permease-like protein
MEYKKTLLTTIGTLAMLATSVRADIVVGPDIFALAFLYYGWPLIIVAIVAYLIIRHRRKKQLKGKIKRKK